MTIGFPASATYIAQSILLNFITCITVWPSIMP
jgi:hypothetical protein